MGGLEIALALLGLVLGLIGLLPIVLDYQRYREQLGLFLDKGALKLDYLNITYDVKSISVVRVLYTGKYYVLRDSPELEMPFRNIFGETNNIKARIGNHPLSIELVRDGEEVKGLCRMSDKNKGDTFVLDLDLGRVTRLRGPCLHGTTS